MKLSSYSTEVDMFRLTPLEALSYAQRVQTNLFDEIAFEGKHVASITNFLSEGVIKTFGEISVEVTPYGEAFVTRGEETCYTLVNTRNLVQLCYSLLLEDYMV